MKFNKKYLLWAILFTVIVIAIGLKTALPFRHKRFITFGFDAARVMTYTQEFKAFGKLPDYDSNRPGLPLFAIFWSNLLNLPNKELLTIPFFTISVGSVVLLYLLSYHLTSNHTSSLVSSAIFSLITYPLLVTDSDFVTYVLTPLRLIVFYSLLKNKHRYFSYILVGFYFSLTLYTNLSHLIATLCVDALFVGMVLYTATYKQELKQRIAMVPFIHVLAYLGAYLYVMVDNGVPLIFPDFFVERMYALDFFNLNPWYIVYVIFGFLVFQLGISLMVLLVKKKLSVPTHVTKIISWVSLSFTFLGILYSLSNILPISLPTLPFRFDAYSLTLLSLPVFIMTRQKKHSVLMSISFAVMLYWFIYILSGFTPFSTQLQNERFSQTPVLLSLPIIGWWISRQTQKKVWALVVIILPLWFMFSWKQYRATYIYPGETDVSRAMEWLRKQPDYTSTTFFAEYFSKPGLAGHEKYYSQTFLPSSSNWLDQRSVGKCLLYRHDYKKCKDVYLNYINKNRIKYLVIETWPGIHWLADELATASGKIVYNDLVRIVRYTHE